MNESKAVVTREKIERAPRHFRKDGGIIRIDPPERVPVRSMVGARHSTYEYPISGTWGRTQLPIRCS